MELNSLSIPTFIILCFCELMEWNEWIRRWERIDNDVVRVWYVCLSICLSVCTGNEQSPSFFLSHSRNRCLPYYTGGSHPVDDAIVR